MQHRSLNLDVAGPVARITIAGETENRIDRRVLLELRGAATEIAAQPEISVVLLDAAGPDFCVGWQAAFREELARERPEPASGLLDPFGPLADLACPVVAAAQGRAFSAGLELLLCADIRLAAADASFGMPEAVEGRLPLAGATQRLPRLLGRARALAMLLTGDSIDAATALSAGLVSRVVPAGDLAATSSAVATRLAERGPIALRYAKEAVKRGLEMPLEQALRYETDLSVILQTTEDRAEGVRAFLEKRPPRFEGR